MKVLLTGGGGFVGHHAILYLINNTDWDLVVTDSFAHGGLYSRIRDIEKSINSKRLKIVKHDLSTPIDKITANEFGKINTIVNAASLANVDDSIQNPVPFIQNNINVSCNIFEYARFLDSLELIIHISTDEVFGDAHGIDQHFENSLVSPSNPYSASKAGQEAIANAYWRTYGLPAIITNTTNMFGERQSGKAFIPKTIFNLINNKTISIHSKNIGNENKISSRFYLYVQNQIDSVKFLIENSNRINKVYSEQLKQIEKFNLSGDKELYNDDLVFTIANILNISNFDILYTNPKDTRPGFDLRYSLNDDKIKSIGWKQPIAFDDAIEKTVLWYKNNKNWLEV